MESAGALKGSFSTHKISADKPIGKKRGYLHKYMWNVLSNEILTLTFGALLPPNRGIVCATGSIGSFEDLYSYYWYPLFIHSRVDTTVYYIKHFSLHILLNTTTPVCPLFCPYDTVKTTFLKFHLPCLGPNLPSFINYSLTFGSVPDYLNIASQLCPVTE